MPDRLYTPQLLHTRQRFGWRDIVLLSVFWLLLYVILHAAHQMTAPYSPDRPLNIDLSPAALPGYASRSVLRMFIAFGASLLFSLVYGYIAAFNPRAEKILVPLLDILQSVPVLGFLSVTVLLFMKLFPGSLLGLECASIFAIFTSQAWNLTFSFYHSLKLLPVDLVEAATVYRLSAWQRFVKLEVPFSTIGLVWNGMMSFGGGWFFLAASEAISVLNHQYLLPGIGSYMAVAVDRGDGRAIAWAIMAMIGVVILIDQLFWRPIVAWSQKFKFEQSESEAAPTSAVLDLFRRSSFASIVHHKAAIPAGKALDRLFGRVEAAFEHRRAASRARSLFPAFLMATFALFLGWAVRANLSGLRAALDLRLIAHVFAMGFLTFMRVAAMVILATLVWTPIGVRIGFSPRLAKIAQPIVQIGASFPANLLFPVAVLVFIRLKIDLNWGSILLLALGTQWYILFNVIAGAIAVPSDLREAALVFRLRGWPLWRKLILPAIFPAWVTGALTAAGGAWNASIVAEVASWGPHHLVAKGLGATIAQATEKGDWPVILWSLLVMSIYVVALNRLLWKPLYALAEERYHLG